MGDADPNCRPVGAYQHAWVVHMSTASAPPHDTPRARPAVRRAAVRVRVLIPHIKDPARLCDHEVYIPCMRRVGVTQSLQFRCGSAFPLKSSGSGFHDAGGEQSWQTQRPHMRQ